MTGPGRESDYMPSPVHPPTESQDLGVASGTPDVVSDPRISSLLSEFMTSWQANLNLKEGKAQTFRHSWQKHPLAFLRTQCMSGTWYVSLCVCVQL